MSFRFLGLIQTNFEKILKSTAQDFGLLLHFFIWMIIGTLK